MSTDYEVYRQIKNKTRKQILLFIYQEPRNYTQLVELTQLKPGSLYHHLKILDSLVEKVDHGLYAITPTGRQVVEDLGLLPATETKPAVHNDAKSTVPQLLIETSEESSLDDRLANVWLGWNSFVLSGFVLLIAVLLSFFGVSLAGSAIYAVGKNAILFNLLSIVTGVILLYYVESLLYANIIYNKLKFIVTIRMFSMIPGAIVGLSLLLLFILGYTVSAIAFPWLFALTLLAGLIVSAIGISYLRAQSFNEALFTASIPILVDLLFGAAILLTTT